MSLPYEMWYLILEHDFFLGSSTMVGFFGRAEAQVCKQFHCIVNSIRKKYHHIGQCEVCGDFLCNGQNGNVSLDCAFGVRKLYNDMLIIGSYAPQLLHLDYIPNWEMDATYTLPSAKKHREYDYFVCAECRQKCFSKSYLSNLISTINCPTEKQYAPIWDNMPKTTLRYEFFSLDEKIVDRNGFRQWRDGYIVYYLTECDEKTTLMLRDLEKRCSKIDLLFHNRYFKNFVSIAFDTRKK